MKKVFVVLFVLVIAVAAFLYFPRGAAVGTTNAATLAILNTAVDGSRSATASPAMACR